MRQIIADDKTANLCDECLNEFATCHPQEVEFGCGVGNDNVIMCTHLTLPLGWCLADIKANYGKIVTRKEGY